MFSGLIGTTGKVRRLERSGETMRLTVAPQASDFLKGAVVGDSIAVDGTCLTIEQFVDDGFTVTLMPQSFIKTIFKERRVGDLLNLERSLKVGERLEGHIVTGHVDEVTRVIERRVNENAIELTFALPSRLRRQVVSQGSVAINGVSLTVMQADKDSFSVGLIPHTQVVTNLDELQVDDLINMETDILGKYVARNMKVGLK
ncbi:MAG: riboflavin synthase [Lactobacillaceae bacterium]|nr:riboflavin synthase [Lactobacillaceae bacterium]